MSEFFRQFSDDQLALMLCGLAILGCWCLLQISFYIGKATNSAASANPMATDRSVTTAQEKAA